MNVDFVRSICLSLPQAKENLQWGETSCFKVRSKLFALPSLDSAPPRLTLKCSPERFSELIEIEGIVPAPYVGRYKWVMLESLEVLSREELEDAIRLSYDLVTAKLPNGKKKAAKKPALARMRKPK